MSYILEALKKAQAERQLGNAPTIHAPPPIYAAPDRAQGGNRRYLMIGLGAGVLAATAALLWLRQGGEPPARLAEQASVVAPGAVPAAAPAAPPSSAPVSARVSAPASVPASVPASAPASESASRPVAVAAPPAAPAPALREAAPVAVRPAPVPSRLPEPAAPPAAPRAEPLAATPQPVPVAAAAPAAAEESLRSLQQLPEAVRREIPQVAIGGYIYSPTPGESLLLVDKMLRREGEEVAPGLVLERLTPKAAVMNYRGTRYRVAY